MPRLATSAISNDASIRGEQITVRSDGQDSVKPKAVQSTTSDTKNGELNPVQSNVRVAKSLQLDSHAVHQG